MTFKKTGIVTTMGTIDPKDKVATKPDTKPETKPEDKKKDITK